MVCACVCGRAGEAMENVLQFQTSGQTATSFVRGHALASGGSKMLLQLGKQLAQIVGYLPCSPNENILYRILRISTDIYSKTYRRNINFHPFREQSNVVNGCCVSSCVHTPFSCIASRPNSSDPCEGKR